MPKAKSLAEALVAASGGRPLRKAPDELPDEALINLPSTESIQHALDVVDARLTSGATNTASADTDTESDSIDRRERNNLTSRKARLERELEEASERDRRSRKHQRPVGCWCLGQGGRGERGVAVGQRIDPENKSWEANTEANLNVTICEEYCPCPDGARLTAEHLEAVKAATDGRAQRRAQDALTRHWADVGLPEKSTQYPTLDDYPTSDFRQRKAITEVKAWRPPRWLFLHGPSRRGKSTIAAALARHAEHLGWQVRFRSVPALLERLKAAMDHDDETVDDVLKPLLEVKLLVLDDLGTETSTRWVIERLFILLDTRLNKNLTTIITSNLDLGTAVDSLYLHLASGGTGPDFSAQAVRIVARIREASTVICVDGPTLVPDQAEALEW